MKIFTLAKLFEHKYRLKSQAISVISPEMKRDLVNAYNLYVGPRAKYPVLQMFSDAGEPVSKIIVDDMNSIVANLEHNDHDKIIDLMWSVVDAITPETKEEVKLAVKTLPINEQHRNYLNILFQKFDTVTVPLVSIISKMLGKHKLLPKETAPLSKEQIRMFLFKPQAEKYGLTSEEHGLNPEDIIQKLLEDPTMRPKLKKLINAVNRGRTPKNGPEIAAECAEIKERWLSKQTGIPPRDPHDINQELAQQGKELAQLEKEEQFRADEDLERLKPQIKQRDLEQIERDRERLIKSEGSYMLKQIFKKRYL